MLSEELLPPPHTSWKQVIAAMPEKKRDSVLSALKDEDMGVLTGDWFLESRREQIPPLSDWEIWVIMAGRGFGKNFAGSNWLIDQHYSGEAKESCIIAATSGDLRRNCLEGPSGILSLAPDYFRPKYKSTNNILIWPNGSKTHLYTSEKPNRLRGPNHDRAWCDELSYWQYAQTTWDMLQLTLRYGAKTKCMITMTPRPIPLVKELVKRETEEEEVVITRGSTLDNKGNLSGNFVETIINQYKGTRLYRQEVGGELLTDVDGALWSHEMLDGARVDAVPSNINRTVVSIDPSTTSGEKANETGIIVASRTHDKHAYIQADISCVDTPNGWAKRAVKAYFAYDANLIVAEKNQGGEMISDIIHNIDPMVPVKLVHASKGKVARAEPVAALYEVNRVHHVGSFPKLEDEQCIFVPGDIIESPNRVDALVWGITELLVQSKGRAGAWGH